MVYPSIKADRQAGSERESITCQRIDGVYLAIHSIFKDPAFFFFLNLNYTLLVTLSDFPPSLV